MNTRLLRKPSPLLTALSLLLSMLILAACQESLESRCYREAKQYTEKHCPLPVEKDVVMDSMTFDRATHTISYVYTLSGLLDDSATIRRQDPRQLLLQQLKNTPNLKLYKDAGYNFRYVYYSAQHPSSKLFDTTFHQEDYQ